MHKGPTLAALLAAALVVPATAAADCGLPKGVYTAGAELQYQASLFEGQAGTSLSNLVGSLGTPTDKRRIEEAIADLTRGNAARATTFAGAVLTYASAVSAALSGDPPQCETQQQRPKRRASARRHRR